MNLREHMPLPAIFRIEQNLLTRGGSKALAIRSRLVQENELSLLVVFVSALVAWMVFGFHWVSVVFTLMTLAQRKDTVNQLKTAMSELQWLPGSTLPLMPLTQWTSLSISPAIVSVYDLNAGLVFVPSVAAITEHYENYYTETGSYMSDKWYTMSYERFREGDPKDDMLTPENIRLIESQMFYRVFVGCIWAVAIVINLA